MDEYYYNFYLNTIVFSKKNLEKNYTKYQKKNCKHNEFYRQLLLIIQMTI